MDTRQISRGKIVVFSLVPLLLLLIVLEVAGRIIYPFDSSERARIQAKRDPRVELTYLSERASAQSILEDIYRMEHRYLPFLGWIGRPNIRFPTIQTNDLGFRDSPIAPRGRDEFRIVILGGSTAWGLGASSNDTTVAGKLEALLNEESGPTTYRVMSGAYLGWKSREELIALMEFHHHFDPDLVISLTGYNDLYALSHRPEDELLMRPESQLLSKAVEDNLRPMATLTALRKVAGSMGVWRLVVHFRELASLRAPKEWQVQYNSELASKAIPRIVDRYRTMAEYALRHGFHLMLALQPDIYATKKQLTSEEIEVKKRFAGKAESIERTFSSYRTELIRALASLAQSGVTVANLTDGLDSVVRPVFIDAPHLNDDGYEVLARLLKEHIRSVPEPGESQVGMLMSDAAPLSTPFPGHSAGSPQDGR